jgi:hypothetical protein
LSLPPCASSGPAVQIFQQCKHKTCARQLLNDASTNGQVAPQAAKDRIESLVQNESKKHLCIVMRLIVSSQFFSFQKSETEFRTVQLPQNQPALPWPRFTAEPAA